MKVKVICTIKNDNGTFPPDTVVEVDQKEAERLIGLGAAESVVDAGEKEEKKEEKKQKA